LLDAKGRADMFEHLLSFNHWYMFKSSFQNIVLAVILLIPSLDPSAQRVTGLMAKAEWSQPS